MQVTLPAYIEMLKKNGPNVFNPDFFELRDSKALGINLRVVKPVLNFPDGRIRPGYNVGTRGNGVDDAKWPNNLLEEVVKL